MDKMKMNRFLSLLLVLAICFAGAAWRRPAALADDDADEIAEEMEDREDADDDHDDDDHEDADDPDDDDDPEDAEDLDELEDTVEISYPDELRVGHTTITKGDFFTEMFGNNTADIDVRALIHGYNLVNWDQNQGVYVIDESVVENVMVAADEDGNKTYFLILYDDLYYSDGTPITAWDYAFSLLLMMSPEIEQIGGKIYRAEHILGFKEYITGELPYLTGVGVIDDHTLSITLDHEFLPYFFEIGLLLCVPYPIDVIAPGCKVYAGDAYDMGDGYGYGIRIGNADESVTEPVYTADLLRKTIMDSETGYNSHPAVSSGPYVLTDYDYKTAHFEINDYYKGAWIGNALEEGFPYEVQEYAGVGSGTVTHNSHTGPGIYEVMRLDDQGNENPMYLVKPTIEKISFSLADNDTMAQDLADGTFHLVNKVTYGPAITACRNMNTQPASGGIGDDDDFDDDFDDDDDDDEDGIDEDGEDVQQNVTEILSQNYPRIGMSFLTFNFKQAAVCKMEVRQAIAWCMDRDQIMKDYCQGFGMVVNGYYGLEKWEYLICSGRQEYPIVYAADEENPARANTAYANYANMYAATDEEFEQMTEEWEKLTLDNLVNYNVYDLDTDPERTDKVGIVKAKKLLDDAGWTLNRNGETYQPGVDDVRCKMVDGELVALDLTLMYPRGNHIVDTIQENFLDNLAEAGIRVTLVPEEMEELLKAYYNEKERTADMIYLATNFHVVVDPSITYSMDTTLGHQVWNNTFSDDEELWERAVDMRKTEPMAIYDYMVKWVSFQERYNEVLPAIPIYTNIYFDFYTSQLQNYNITTHVTWTQAILEAYFGEVPEAPEDDELLDDDEMMLDD